MNIKKSTETKKRTITSILILFLILPFIIMLGLKPTFDNQMFDYSTIGLFILLMLVVFYETTNAFFKKEKGEQLSRWNGLPILTISSVVLASLAGTVMVLFVMKGDNIFSDTTLLGSFIGVFFAGFLILFLTTIFSNEDASKIMTLFIIEILFVLYMVLLFITTSLLLWNITIMITLGIVTSDTMGYFGGKKFGKTKLFPLISPNKTIEGYIIGFVSSIIVTTTLYFTLIHIYPINQQEVFQFFPPFTGILTSILIALIAPLGDLFFSKIKRNLEIKDFGNSLPGHGGVLDRIDSHIFAYSLVSIILLLIFLL